MAHPLPSSSPRPGRPARHGLHALLRRRLRRLALLALLALEGCQGCEEREAGPDAGPDAAAPELAEADASASLFDAASPEPEEPEAGARGPGCPEEMVLVRGAFCVDRYEASLVELRGGLPLSPYHFPAYPRAWGIHDFWENERLRVGGPQAREVPLPILPPYQRSPFEPRAVSKRGVVPQGYATGEIAKRACENAGKRLCRLEEWRQACRGEEDRDFPYGNRYVDGKCNVFRESHPAMELHGNPSVGHSDPRLNLVRVGGKPLLRRTGATPGCASRWGDDAIYDMVGNLDEWVDDPEGTFVGGFYARSTREGCRSTIRSHPFHYFDYSTGFRCCRSAELLP